MHGSRREWSLSSTATEEITATNERRKINFHLAETVWTWMFREFSRQNFLTIFRLLWRSRLAKRAENENMMIVRSCERKCVSVKMWEMVEPGNEIWRHSISPRLIECVKPSKEKHRLRKFSFCVGKTSRWFMWAFLCQLDGEFTVGS